VTFTGPSIVTSGALSAIYGLAYGLLAGKAGTRLMIYVAAAAVGFVAGFPVAEHYRFSPYLLGDVPIVECTVLSVVAMSILLIVRI
jgi:hypothetical protein